LLGNLQIFLDLSFHSLSQPPEHISGQLSRKEDMERGDGQEKDSSENGKKDEMESSKSEENPNLGIHDQERSESSDQAESGESDYQPPNRSATKGDSDDNAQASQTKKTIHFNPAAPGEHQTKGPGPHGKFPFGLGHKDLSKLWEKQQSELNALCAKNEDLQEERDRFRDQYNALWEEFSGLRRMRNELERTIQKLHEDLENLEKCNVNENEKSKETNEALKRKLHEFEAQVEQGEKEWSELSRTNDGLLGELKHAKDVIKEREKAIEALKAEVQKFEGIELRDKVLEAEVDKLKEDLMKAREQIQELVAQQREMGTEMYEIHIAKIEGENTSPSLEDELRESASVSTGERVEEAEHIPDQVAYSTQTSEPVAKEERTHAGTQKFATPSAGDKRPEKLINDSPSVQTGDVLASDAENKVGEVGHTTKSTRTLEIPFGEGSLAEQMPSTFVDGTGPTEVPDSRINSMSVCPPTPRTDSTVIDSEPSPLSLNGRSNSFYGKARPGRARLSSISEVGTSDFDWFRTDSPPPRFAENTPELPTLDGRVGNVVSQAASTEFEVQTVYHNTEVRGEIEGHSTQGRTSEGRLKAKKSKSNVARKIQYVSIAWWLLLLCLALSRWLSRDEKQFWMQANELTRQGVLGLRDDRWAEPSWLTRMSFYAENVLEIDRSRLA
jgi:uncharacterized coiled-coil DUF342 family protein